MILDLYRLFMPYLYHYIECSTHHSRKYLRGFVGFTVEPPYQGKKFKHLAWGDYISDNGLVREFGFIEVFATFQPTSRVKIWRKQFFWEVDNAAEVYLPDYKGLYKRMLMFKEPIGFANNYLLPLIDDKPTIFKHVADNTVSVAALVVKTLFSPLVNGFVPKQYTDLFTDLVEGTLSLFYERGYGTTIEFYGQKPYEHYLRHSFVPGKPWLDAESLDDLLLITNRMMGHKFTVKTLDKFYTLLAMKALEGSHAGA